MKLSKNIDINAHIIELVKSKQPLYKPIFAFSLVKQEILLAHIKTSLKTGFI